MGTSKKGYLLKRMELVEWGIHEDEDIGWVLLRVRMPITED